MAITSRYFITNSFGANYVDFELKYGALSLQGEEIAYSGSEGVDLVFVRPGILFDFTASKGGQDKLYLEGAWGEYLSSIDGSSGVMTLTRTVGEDTETVRFAKDATDAASDVLVFADGTVNSLDIYNHLENGATAPVPAGETSLAPSLPATLNARIKAFALDAAGETFALPNPGINFIASGSAGVDVVYVKAGANIDATALKGGSDFVYFRGRWGDYAKSVDLGVITFTRTVDGYLEVVKVAAGIGANNDRLVFVDGAVLSNNAKAALLADPNVALAAITGYDPATTTPGVITLTPLTPETDTGTSDSDGVTANRKPVVSGTATPGSAFVLGVDLGNDGSADLSYAVVADVQGIWTVDLATATPLSGSLPTAGLPYGETKLIAGSVNKVVKIQEFYISGVAWDEAGETVRVVLHSPQGITVTPASAHLGPTLKIKVGASERIAEFDQAATDALGVEGELVFVYRANPWEVDTDGVEVVAMSFDARGATLLLADQSTLASLDHDGTAANAASAFRSDVVVSSGGHHDADSNSLDLDDVIVLEPGQVSAGDIVALGDGRNLVKLAEVGLGVAYTHNNDVSLGLRGTIDLSGIAGDVTVDFIDSRIYMTSGGAADTIAGFNAIVSGQGNDAIRLSAGIAERLIYAGPNSGQDEIFGFMTGAGGDVVDLSAALDKFRDPAAPLTSDPLSGVSASETAGGVRIDVDADRNGSVDFSLTLRDTSFAPNESAAQFVQRLVSDGNLLFLGAG